MRFWKSRSSNNVRVAACQSAAAAGSDALERPTPMGIPRPHKRRNFWPVIIYLAFWELVLASYHAGVIVTAVRTNLLA